MKSPTSLDNLRKEAAEKAMHKLVYETIPSLEQVIAGTPTGPRRDKLTEANILLHQIVAE
jgi:hypothetical protein